ncbi:bifunctional riboflavin kinase/FAD synthetase [Sporosarcina sp. Marseille-Q4063]|nr:bifunctional riboflavin kinase/FAD synthetase [Sporosarcina sp. Marseille-Q4063]
MTIDNDEEYSLAIGFFDGLHKGHQTVITKAIEKAKELSIRSAVMTFNPHPSHVLGGGKNKIGYITPFEEKKRLLENMGVDAVFVVKFDMQLASLKPNEFVDLFIKSLGVKHVTAGFDYSFGSKGAGKMEDMKKLSDGVYETTIVGKVTDNADKISSTRIRKLLSEGNVEDASLLLGRNFRLIGTVVGGEKKGRQLGFPTANVLPSEGSILPENGVYAVRFIVDGTSMNGVCNVGVKPTFNNPEVKSPMVEVHILDYDGDLYGKEVAVEWVKHIRQEKKFESIDSLISQIEKDKEMAIEILAVS